MSVATRPAKPAGAIDPPEPDLSAKEILARVRGLRERLVERQETTEQLRRATPETHHELAEAGVYRMLVPRRFGGYEFDIPSFVKVLVEMARGCPSSAWGAGLSAAHALLVGGWFSEEAQAAIFREGDFRAASAAAPVGKAIHTAEGWEISGTHRYCSGIPYSTHYLGQAPLGGDGPLVLFVVPSGSWEMLDDWGTTLGLKGSGSNSIVLDKVRIPEGWALENFNMLAAEVAGGTVGSRLHGNAMYAGRAVSMFSIEFAALMAGMALGALDEYEHLMRVRTSVRPPIVTRVDDPDYQRWFGWAIGRLAAAEAAVVQAAEQYMEACQENVDGGEPFDMRQDFRLQSIGRESMWLSWNVMQEIIFRTAGSSAAQDGSRIQRVFRDMAMGWGHLYNVQSDWIARNLAVTELEHRARPV